MKMNAKLASFAVFASVAGAALAQSAEPAAPAKQADPDIVVSGQPEQVDPEMDKVVCRRDKAVGSRLNTKQVCKTQRQWTADKEQDRRDIDRIQANRPTSGG